jgi:trans-aconitate methyltransferase
MPPVSAAPPDTWASGRAYEAYVGRWSRPVAAELLAWLGAPAGAAWLDLGCGTGALTQSILARAAPARVLGIDASTGFIAHAGAHVPDARATFVVGDAQQLTLADASFDAAVSALVLNFLPHPERAAAEMARVVRPGGLVAAYVWDYADRMQLLRHFWDAALALDPSAAELDEGRRFPLCRQDRLAALFDGAGLTEVTTRTIDVPTRFVDFDDCWTPFLGGQGPAPTYVAHLDASGRDALRERLRRTLPAEADGSIALVARAFAVRGVRGPAGLGSR